MYNLDTNHSSSEYVMSMCTCNQGRFPCSCKPDPDAEELTACREAWEREKPAVPFADYWVGWNACAQARTALDAEPADGATYDHRTDLHAYFGLTYASWLTIPRVLLQEMPGPWKRKMAFLLNEYDDAFPSQPSYGTTVRVTENGKIIRTPEWLINYRHPNHEMINQVRGVMPAQGGSDE